MSEPAIVNLTQSDNDEQNASSVKPAIINLCEDDDDLITFSPTRRTRRKRSYTDIDTEATTVVPSVAEANNTTNKWEVILLKDCHEVNALDAHLTKAGICWESRRLPVFDYLWIARERKNCTTSRTRSPVNAEYVLGYGVERKRADDLKSAMRTRNSKSGWTRSEHQRLAMNYSGLPNKTLLVEGNLYQVPNFALHGMSLNTMIRWVHLYESTLVRDGYHIARVPMKNYERMGDFLSGLHREVATKVSANEIQPVKCATFADLQSKMLWFLDVSAARKGLALGSKMIPLVLEALPERSTRDAYENHPDTITEQLVAIKTEKGRGISRTTATKLLDNLFKANLAAAVTPDNQYREMAVAGTDDASPNGRAVSRRMDC